MPLASHARWPALDSLLIVTHVLVALASTVMLALTAGYAEQARQHGISEATARYFAAGSNRMSRALYLVPVLGAALIGINDRGYGLDQLWLWSSLGLWSMAAALAQTIVWPGETTIRERLQDTASGDLPADLRATCGHVALAAGLGAVCMTIVFPVMVLKPGAPGH